jgi:ATP-dependent helicase/nuclease subunit B
VLPLFDSQLPPRLVEIVLNALEDGAVVVTANARAARSLRLSYAEEQRKNGRAMWASPAILDWDSWLNHLWQEQAFSNPGAPLLLTDLQEHTLWLHAQQNDAHLVVWPDGLASLAQSAYQLLSEYELHPERNSTWFEPDAEHFRQWAKAFDQLCRSRNWTSSSRLESLLIEAVKSGAVTLPAQILLAGFDRFTPAQESLLQHVSETGTTVDMAVMPHRDTSTYTLLAAGDARDELRACAEWCRHKLENNPAIRIGVIAPDIRGIRAEAERIFRAELMPQSLDLANESAPMPFEFSLGVPISTVPVVGAAILLLRWISKPLLEEDVTWLLLSGFFNRNAAETLDLAVLDFKRRDSGALSPEISLQAFVKGRAPSHFSKRAQRVLKATEESQILTGNRAYTDWCEIVQHFLQLAEWPGFRSLDSVQFQAQKRWLKLLDEISLLDFAGHKVSFSTLLETVERHANETTFTPESHHAPIQILGAFESSGQTFDSVWFLGVDDAQWPPTGRPHPLLPVGLQRRAKMPHSDTATDTDMALTVTLRIAESAPECIFSHALQNKEGELRPSPVLAATFRDTNLEEISAADFRKRINVPEFLSLNSQAESTVIPSQIAPWPADRVAGGADVLKDQGACPFRAFAKRRFATQPLNRTEWGLDAAQRGNLLHSVLEAIWSPQSPEQFRMLSLYDLKNVIAAGRLDETLRYHIGIVFESLVREHAEDSWMQAYLESEQRRLLIRLREWMRYEADRLPFTVEKREERLDNVSVGDLKLNLRADRIDELPNGSHLLIDYKTGEVSASAWKGERPDEPQLPLYAVYGNVENVIGLLFAQIRAGKTEFVGRVENARQTLLTGLKPVNSLVNQPYDKQMHDAWQQALLQLAEEFLHGEASVAPKHGADTCKYCPLPGLCRVAEADLANEPEDAEADYV